MLKYFINPILQVTTLGDVKLFDCHVVDEHYKEIYRDTLTEDEKDGFEKIMASDTGAILYIKHEKLGKLAQFKIDELQKQSVIDGTKFP